jgi:ParB family chromosome partitioning protein
MNKIPDKQRKVLGRGLSALLPSRSPSPTLPPVPPITPDPSGIRQILIAQIDPNPVQPRTAFDYARLEELAESIRANGIIQPIIVRAKGDRYELVAGERRWRAAKIAGLETVPGLVQDYADDRLLEIALIENLQREDLPPIETAQALNRLVTEMGLSHEEIGQRTGKDRTTVTNLLRLLKLPAEVQLLLAEHRLSMGHARALLGLPTEELQRQLGDQTAAQGYSVRQVERMVKAASKERGSVEDKAETPTDPNVTAAIRELEAALGARVRLSEKSDQSGRLEIYYHSQDELNRIYELILGAAQPK